MPFDLPPLPFDTGALEPYIDRETMELHHGQHHAGYVKKLNAAIERHPELRTRTLQELLQDVNHLPADVRSAVRNNGGGHANHSMFWHVIGPGQGGPPGGAIGAQINRDFGSFDTFRDRFSKAALGLFGSGWVWLVDRHGTLSIETTPNQDNPLMEGGDPVFGLDVWEHAYYLKYRNRRADYIEAWWHIVNWSAIDRMMLRQAVESVR